VPVGGTAGGGLGCPCCRPDELRSRTPLLTQGYPPSFNTSAYSGYLSTLSPNRSLHYVFLESANGKGNNDPVTLWLNGGPGCSSLLGFLQEIGPYYLEDGIDYKQGDNLTENKYSWHKISNLLFLESPAGVGYSYNLDQTFQYNDAVTAHDSLAAVLNFFEKFPELRSRKMFIAGESYAGKYIPDLAQLIDGYNYRAEGPAINLAGLLIGNGVMSFDTLQHSTYEFMIDRSFVDPEILLNYRSSCQFDPHSAGCRFFEIEFDKGTEEVNPYNVYGYCYYNDSFDATPKQQKK
jgi:serine carboxypeptidase-like clade 2